MKPIRYIPILLTAAALLSGCAKSRLAGPEPQKGTFTIRMEVPGATDASKALTDADERYLQTIDLLLFEKTDAGEMFYQHIAVDDIDNTGHVKTFRADLPVGTGKELRIVLLANARAEVNNATLLPTLTKQQVLDGLKLFDVSAQWDVSTPRHLPMWGESAGLITLTTADTPIPSIQMLRSVVRLDVVLGDELVASGKFTPALARIYHYNEVVRVAPAEGHYSHETRSVSAPSLPPNPYPSGNFQAWNFSTGATRGEIYLAEHSATQAPGASGPLALLIQGNLDNAGYRWYLVELAGRDLLRNHRYTVTITDVTSQGYNDPYEAMAEQSGLNADIVPWNEADADGSLEGDFTLDISKTHFRFNADGRGGSEFYHGNTYSDHLLDITTDSPAGWQLVKVTDAQGNELTGDAQWVTIKTGLTILDLETFTEQNLPDQLHLSILPNNTDAARAARLHIRAGQTEHTLYVVQDYLDGCGSGGTPLIQQIGQRSYKTHRYVDNTQLFTRCWMVENLIEPLEGEYDNDEYYLTTFQGKQPGERGYYYSGEKVHIDRFDPCPEGWHIPDVFEAQHLGYSFFETPYTTYFPTSFFPSLAEEHKWWVTDPETNPGYGGVITVTPDTHQIYDYRSWGHDGFVEEDIDRIILMFMKSTIATGFSSTIAFWTDYRWDNFGYAFWGFSKPDGSNDMLIPFAPVRCVKDLK